MRQRVLKFPVGREFKKLLNDKNEWSIITDQKLKILVAKRGGYGTITKEVIEETALEFLRKDYPNHIKVYLLHTHPERTHPSPSDQDLVAFYATKLSNLFMGINVAGYGVITEKGITIIKLGGHPLENMFRVHTIKFEFNHQLGRNLVKSYQNRNPSLKNEVDEKKYNDYHDSLSSKERENYVGNAGVKAVKQLASRSGGDIKVKSVRRKLPHFIKRRGKL